MTCTRTLKIKRLLFAWLAMVSLILATACGKKDGGSGDPAPAPAEANKPNGKQEAPKDEKKEKGPGAGSSAQEKSGDESAKVGGKKNARGGEVILDPRGRRSSEIFEASENLGPTRPGNKFADDLYFSGAGQDFLREQLIDIVSSQDDAGQRRRNSEFAREIGLVTVEVNWPERSVNISIAYKKSGKKITPPDVKAVVGRNLQFKGFEKSQKVSLTGACMDLPERLKAAQHPCHTVHLRLERGERGSTSVAHVLTRLSPVYFTFPENPGTTRNGDYDFVSNILEQSVANPGGFGTIHSLGLYTSEVIGGASEFAVVMKLNPNSRTQLSQMFGLQGPLVKPAEAMELDEAIDMVSNVDSDASRSGDRSVLKNLIREARLIRNDGRGNMQFNLVIPNRRRGEGEDDVLRLTIARIHNETRGALVLR